MSYMPTARRRAFNRQIVADAPRDGPVLVFAREFLRVSARLQVWRTISVAFKRDGGHRDHGGLRELLFQIIF